MSQLDNQAASDAAAVDPEKIRQFLTFSLNDEIYGIGILQIREIIGYGNLTQVPLMPDFISGVINLRGKVVPVVNLARRFDMQPGEIGKRSSIVIVDIRASSEDRVEVGIVVDMVNEVIELGVNDIAAAPAFGARIRADFIQGMGKVEEKLMILLDVNHVLAIDELSAIADINDGHNGQASARTA